jgi:predicted transposase YbfD/YdcC
MRVRYGGQHSRHLLAALDHAHGVVLGQAGVDVKTNEIPMFSALLDRIEITDAIITADALHAQHAHPEIPAPARRRLLIVKRNQPGLHAQFAAIIRGHWGIEDRLHWVRDVDFDEDRFQIRTASGPQIMASLLGHHHPAAHRRHLHRRRPALSRPPVQLAPADDHEVLIRLCRGPGVGKVFDR